jgi:1-deoxy-D-xylulose-5-phosphate synthase
MHEAGVTFVLDRAGVTGDDGPSHNGMWDMALLRVVPNLELAAPRDGEQLKLALNRAMDKSDHPTVVRFPKGVLGKEVTAVRQLPFGDLLLDAQDPDVTIVSIGALAGAALEAAQILTSQGYLVSVIDPVWAYPVNQQLVTHLATSSLVITVEDGLVSGGVGDAIAAQMRNQGLDNPVLNLGIPKEFLRQANRGVLLAEFGLDAQGIAKTVRARLQATVG